MLPISGDTSTPPASPLQSSKPQDKAHKEKVQTPEITTRQAQQTQHIFQQDIKMQTASKLKTYEEDKTEKCSV
eukprot:1347580-Ditylum_brightwellii.AAC.1